MGPNLGLMLDSSQVFNTQTVVTASVPLQVNVVGPNPLPVIQSASGATTNVVIVDVNAPVQHTPLQTVLEGLETTSTPMVHFDHTTKEPNDTATARALYQLATSNSNSGEQAKWHNIYNILVMDISLSCDVQLADGHDTIWRSTIDANNADACVDKTVEQMRKKEAINRNHENRPKKCPDQRLPQTKSRKTTAQNLDADTMNSASGTPSCNLADDWSITQDYEHDKQKQGENRRNAVERIVKKLSGLTDYVDWVL